MLCFKKEPLDDGETSAIRCLRISKPLERERLCSDSRNGILLLYGVRGRTVVCAGEDDSILGAGCLVMLRGEALRDAYAAEGEAEYIAVQFLPAALFAQGETLAEYTYVRLFLEKAEGGKIYFIADALKDTPLDSLLRRMADEWETKSFGYELSLRADLMAVVLRLMRKLREKDTTFGEPGVTEEQRWLIARALVYVREHYAVASEKSCAQALGVSASYLSRVFKKSMKCSFSACLAETKLKEAEKLLLTTSASVTEIAEQVGFSTAAYFIASFRSRYHVTPARYRKLLRGEEIEEE